MAREYISKEAGKTLLDIQKKSDSLSKVLDKTTRTFSTSVDELVEGFKSNREVLEKFKKSLAESSGVAYEYAKLESNATLKVKDFGDAVFEAAQKLPIIGSTLSQAGKDPTGFAFEQQIPIFGIKAKLIQSFLGLSEDVVSTFVSDFAKNYKIAISQQIQAFDQYWNSQRKMLGRQMTGRENLVDQIANELGPYGYRLSDQQITSFYDFKTKHILDPTEKTRQRVQDLLYPKVAEWSRNNVGSTFGVLDGMVFGAGGGFIASGGNPLAVIPGGIAGGVYGLIHSQLGLGGST